jgi:hypothetical protein
MAVTALAMILAGGLFGAANAQEAAKQEPAKQEAPKYTMAEYNTYKAAADEKNPAQQVKLLDDFVQRYPSSTLLQYAYQNYYQSYAAQKNNAKAIEYADKLVALKDKAEAGIRYQAYYARAFLFLQMDVTKDPNAAQLGGAARDAAIAGLAAMPDFKKPEGVDEKTYADTKKQHEMTFDYTAASGAGLAKDYATAVQYYKATLVLTPGADVTWYRLGVTYLAMDPSKAVDGFWALAHAVSLKGQSAERIKTSLRRQLGNYQQATCEPLMDAEMNELIALAGSSPERPASYTLPSATDLSEALKTMTILTVITDLKAGGDKAKLTWLAACGQEFPDVTTKFFEAAASEDKVALKVAFVSNQAEYDAATTPNMEVTVTGQPEATRLEKDSAPRFTGKLTGYDPEPAFLLHWTDAKVKAEDIPAAKKAAPAKKAPAKKAPAKKAAAKKKAS